MIITRTPYRLSLFGGGTDYPGWYREHGGSVIGMAINKYCYISVRHLPPFFAHKHRIVYSELELTNSIPDIRHPAVRAVLTEMKVNAGLEIHHDGDLPARSGLGSSSSFTVGLLMALYALRGEMVTKDSLAREAIRIEQEVIAESVGSQDQIWAAHGGFNRVDFERGGSFVVSPIIMPNARRQELMEHVVLFFTGVSRNAPDIAKQKIANIGARQTQLAAMKSQVDAAQQVFADPNGSLSMLGKLLHEGWRLKRELSPAVSTKMIDDIYQVGIDCGAFGGKLLGAGGGGFIMFLIPPERRKRLRERLQGLVEVGVDIDDVGSTVVVYQPNGST